MTSLQSKLSLPLLVIVVIHAAVVGTTSSSNDYTRRHGHRGIKPFHVRIDPATEYVPRAGRFARAATARPERLWDYGVIPYEIESNFSGTFCCYFRCCVTCCFCATLCVYRMGLLNCTLLLPSLLVTVFITRPPGARRARGPAASISSTLFRSKNHTLTYIRMQVILVA